MMCKDRLEAYLHEQQVPFESRHHRVAYTAQDVAAVEHIPNQLMAKVVLVFADGKLTMLVLPASHRVDLTQVGQALGAQKVVLAGERDIAETFPDCEVGAMPPYGNLYGIPVYVDGLLAGQEMIVFQAGTHTDTISMKYADYARLVQPKVARFARHFREMTPLIV